MIFLLKAFLKEGLSGYGKPICHWPWNGMVQRTLERALRRVKDLKALFHHLQVLFLFLWWWCFFFFLLFCPFLPIPSLDCFWKLWCSVCRKNRLTEHFRKLTLFEVNVFFYMKMFQSCRRFISKELSSEKWKSQCCSRNSWPALWLFISSVLTFLDGTSVMELVSLLRAFICLVRPWLMSQFWKLCPGN